MERRNSCLFLLLIYFVSAIYLLPTFSNTSFELTNWATAASLVEKNSFDISQMKDFIGENPDLIQNGNKLYSKNLPGISISAAPFYAMARLFLGEPTAENLRISLFIMRFFVSTLPLFFLAVWLFQKDIDAFSFAVFLFAAPLFLFSLLLSAEILAAVLIYLVFRLLYDARTVSLRNNLWAGILSGFILLCHFAAIVPILIFAFGLFFTEPRDRYRRLFFFIFGTLPFITLLLIYNEMIFGSPLASFLNSGIGFPSISKFYSNLFSPLQGLFFYAPVFFFSIFAFFTSQENGTLRSTIKTFTIFLTIFVFTFFYKQNFGWTFGAESLIFILPLMLDSFFDGDVEDFPSFLRGFFFAVSLLFCTIPALTSSFAPIESIFPHNNFWRLLIFENQIFAPTLLTFFGLENGLPFIIPMIILLLLVIYFVWRNSKFPLNFLLGILSAFLAVGIYIFVPGLDNSETMQKRQIIEQSKNNGV